MSEIKTEDESKQDKEDNPPKTKNVTKQVWDWSLINEIKEIWLRLKDLKATREYNDFYKAVT